MQTTTFRISEALRRIKENSLTIPQFQRPFTWRESQVKLLIDSIARNYPIGSILLLAKSPQLELRSRSIEAVIREGYPPDEILGGNPDTGFESYYVLDGQQRLTSVARVLLNAHPTKSYYFDLSRIITDYPADETNWVISRSRSKTNPDRKDYGRLIRSDVALDPTKVEVFVSEYLEDASDNPELRVDRTKRLQASAAIKSVFETIRNYQIPAVILERDAPVESVCRVFETINSTGTRLTTFDLAVAKFFPSPDLRDLWNTTLDEHPVLAQLEVDGERVLQVIALYRAGLDGKYAEPTRSALLNLPADSLEAAWNLATEVLAETYDWAKAQGARKQTLPNHGVLVALAAMRAYERQRPANSTDDHVLRRWYFCKVLQQGARQAANYKISQDFSSLLRYVKTGELPEFPAVVLSREKLLRLTSAIDVRYRAIQCLMATTIRHDLLTGRNIDGRSEIEDHHIFPKRLMKSHGLKDPSLDSVTNRLPVLAASNRALSDQEPSQYIEKIVESARMSGTVGDVKRRFADAMIPVQIDGEFVESQLALEAIPTFLKARADLILERVRDVIGDSLMDVASDPEEDLDDD